MAIEHDNCINTQDLPMSEKLASVLGLSIPPGENEALYQYPGLSMKSIRMRLFFAVGDQNQLLQVLDTISPDETGSCQEVNVWLNGYMKSLILSGRSDSVLHIVKHALSRGDMEQALERNFWIIQIFDDLAGLPDKTFANELRTFLLQCNPSLEKKLSNSEKTVSEQSTLQKKVDPLVRSILARIWTLVKTCEFSVAFDGVRVIEDVLPAYGISNARYAVDVSRAFPPKVRAAIESPPDIKDGDLEKAYHEILSGRPQNGRDLLEVAAMLFPGNYYSLMGLMKCAGLKKDFQTEDLLLNQVLNLHGDDPSACLACADVFINRAERKISVGKEDRALRSFGERLRCWTEALRLLHHRLRILKQNVEDEKTKDRIARMVRAGFDPTMDASEVTTILERTPSEEKLSKGMELAAHGQFDAAKIIVRSLTGEGKQSSVQAYRCLFEIAVLEKNFGEALAAFKVLGKYLSDTVITEYQRRLNRIQEPGSTRSTDTNTYVDTDPGIPSLKTGSFFWSVLGTLKPVDSLANRVAGNRPRKHRA